MARKQNVRVTINREALTLIRLALADGAGDVARTIVETARPPDAPPYGVGLVQGGDWGVWVEGRKVGGTAQLPRNARIKSSPIHALGGYGFPARFQEMGTVNHGSQPFLSPAMSQVEPSAPGIINERVRPTVGRGP